METHNLAKFGIYKNRKQVAHAIHALKDIGIQFPAVSVFGPRKGGARDFAYILHTKVFMGALIGGALGLILGAFFATGMRSTFDLSPGLSGPTPLIIGCLFGLFFGAGSGALVGIGTPERAGRRYAIYMRDGGILLGVHVESPDELAKVDQVLHETGAEDISTANEEKTLKLVEEFGGDKGDDYARP